MTVFKEINLNLQRYGRANIRGNAIGEAGHCAKDGVDTVVDAVCKMDLLSIDSFVYSNCFSKFNKCRSPTKTQANHKNWLSATPTKLNSI